jgi:CheY-like chemotaxis protein
MNRLVAQNTLKYYGCKVTEAVNGIDAIEKLHFQKFDIILMDIQMPEMDGIEATKKIRSELKITTPIIALTANAFKSEIELCKSVGMNDYVTKPFEESILVNTISKHLGMESVLAEAQTFLEDASNNQPLYDLSNLIAISRGDTGFINKMISLFIEQAETTLMQIDTALLGENYSEISRLAHKIKPSIDNMGIISLKEKIRQLENDTKNSPDFNVINELVNEVSEILKNSIHQLLSRPV